MTKTRKNYVDNDRTRDNDDNKLSLSGKRRDIPKYKLDAGSIKNKKPVHIPEYNVTIYIDKKKNEKKVRERYLKHLKSKS